MGITGRTTNKLFKVRTYDTQNLYQVGVNGVTDVTLDDEGGYTITYELDDIIYRTSVSSLDGKIGFDENKPSVSVFSPRTLKFTKVNIFDSSTPAGNVIEGRFVSGSRSIDTTYEIDGFSFDQFTEHKIFKREELIGLIEKPITESDLFIERDEFTIFERHQRLSEINNLASLINYRNGYYEIINTI